jgi:ssDNA-binding Zn-finger/Zn-ribbon topoisomerase 1
LSYAALRQKNLPVDEGYENRSEDEGARLKITQEGQPCRKCSTPVIKRKPRKKPSKNYYFEYYLYCPKCHATYMVEEAKRHVIKGQAFF